MMPDIARIEELFFTNTDLNRESCRRLVADALLGADDGELFLEYRQSESCRLDDGRIRNASFESAQGFGLRAVSGEAAGYAHASELSMAALQRAAETVRTVRSYGKITQAEPPPPTHRTVYAHLNPLAMVSFDAKISVLSDIDTYARACDPRIRQVIATLMGNWQVVSILHADGQTTADVRPLVRLNVSIMVAQGDRMEIGSYGAGGRVAYDSLVSPAVWRAAVDEALRQALVNLDSIPAPAGEMPVVLGPGWPGVLLHEAVGHGLEGDFNRKKTSAFASRMGQRVAAPGVTVVDDGTLPDRRGSLSVDDEGTPTSRTVLIEDGILVGYMQDRLNARLMGLKPTGNGRRQSYAHVPLPRMTNTFMLAGNTDPAEIIASVPRGLYAVHFGGGQVDITSGKFVFSASEAYLIEDGKVGPAVRGATLIGNGQDALTRVTLIGHDLKLDDGIGTCGKSGQSVPVGVGQPTLRVDGITVGGTSQ
ncbi:TldD protein, part of TldE/TldD proteolytic complex [invertebrate metagenome]|uniref:TldD protein, part of TldE/TldD proteolytic complex n=1 Tax=invertebrate metagenome TaxID=1711999 RepID=A0A484HAP0_9ZZZZ